MSRKTKSMIFAVTFSIMTNAGFFAALADRDDHEEKRWYQKIFDWDDDDDHGRSKKGKKRRYQKRYRNDSSHYGKRNLTPVNHPIYKEECGACHFTYQPGLLPSGSWEKILASLEDHFGEFIDIDPDSKKEISVFLRANAANYSSSELSAKIMKSLENRSPTRITEVPYVRNKHHRVSAETLKRESIGSLSNCSACHSGAETGIYEDKDVVIPQ